MTQLAPDPYLQSAIDRRIGASPDLSYAASAIPDRAHTARWRPEDLTADEITEFRRRFPRAVRGRTPEEIADLAAWHKTYPNGVLGPPPEESTFWKDVALAQPRLAGGFIEGVLIDPAASISNGFGALAEFAGAPDLASAFRDNADRIRKQYRRSTMGELIEDGGFYAGTGKLIGNIAPSALSLFASGGASGPVLAYYGFQAFGAGAEDYRSAMEARGLEPSAIDELLVGIGFGAVEVVSEKIGLDLIGKKVTPKFAQEFADLVLRGNFNDAARVLAGVATNATIEGTEEAITQLFQNAMAGNGFYFTPAFDPNRQLLRGVPEAFALGAAGGGLLSFPAVFTHAGRQQLAGDYRKPPTQDELDTAYEALRAFAVPRGPAITETAETPAGGQELSTESLQAEFIGRDEDFWNIQESEDGGTTIAGSEFSATQCTGYACAIRQMLGERVRIMGFSADENPSAVQQLADGHDFAVVDGRYIVDPWIVEVESGTFTVASGETIDVGGRGVFDLESEQDAELIETIYGDRSKWRSMPRVEAIADEIAAKKPTQEPTAGDELLGDQQIADMDDEDRELTAAYLREVADDGINPNTGQELTSEELAKIHVMLDMLSSTGEQQEEADDDRRIEEQQAEAAEAEARTAAGEAAGRVETEDPSILPPPVKDPKPVTTRRISDNSLNTKVNSFIDEMPSPLDVVNDYIATRNREGLWEVSIGSVEFELMSVHPDEVSHLTPIERARITQQGIYISENADSYTLRDELGDSVVEAALEYALHGREGKRRGYRRDVLERPEFHHPDLVLAVFITERRAQLKQEIEAAEVNRMKSDVYDPRILPVGTTFDIAGAPFEIAAVTHPQTGEELRVITSEELGANIDVREIDELPVDAGTLSPPVIGQRIEPTQPGLLGEEFGGSITGRQREIADFLVDIEGLSPLEAEEIVRQETVAARLAEDESGELFPEAEGEAEGTTVFRKIGEAAQKRMAERTRPAGRRKGGLRGGSAPIFYDIADTSIMLAAFAIDKGIKTARAIRQLVDQYVSTRAPHLRKFAPQIATNVRRIIAASTDDEGNIDEAEFEVAAKKVEDTAKRRADRELGTLRDRINLAIFGPPEPATIRESDALRASLEAQERLGRVQAENHRQRSKIAELRRRMTQIRQQAQAKARTIKGLKGELVRLIQDNLPKAIHGKLITDIRDVSTLRGLERSIRKARTALIKYEHELAVKELRRVLDQVGDPSRMHPQFRAEVERLVGGLDLRGLIKGTKRIGEEEIRKLADFHLSYGASVLPAHVLRLMRNAAGKQIADLNTNELRALTDALSHFVLLNREFQRVTRRGKKQNVVELDTTIAGEIAKHHQPRRTLPSGAIEREQRPNILQLSTSYEGTMKLDLYAEWLGGQDSTTWKVLYEDLDLGMTEWLRNYQSSMDAMERAVVRAGLRPGSRELAQMSRTLSNDHGALAAMLRGDWSLRHDTRAVTHSIKLSEGRTLRVTSAERIYLLCTFMDGYSLEQIVLNQAPIHVTAHAASEEFTLSAEDIQAIKNSATNQERQIAEELMADINGPQKEAIWRWSVNRFGYSITRDDLYFPLHRLKQRDVAGLTDVKFGQATLETASILQEREGSNAPIEVRDIFQEFSNLAWVTYAVSEMEPVVDTVHKVIRAPQTASVLADRRGNQAAQHIKKILDEIARSAVGGPVMKGPIASAVNQVIPKLTRGLLATNPRVIMYQPVSFLLASTELPMRDMARAAAGRAWFDSSIDDEVITWSPKLRARFEASAMGLINEAPGAGRRILGFNPKHELFMRGIHLADRAAIRAVWKSATYTIDRTQPRLRGEERMKAIAKLAERVVSRTQPMFDVLHQSGVGIEARQNVLAKAITMFHSQRNQNMNMILRAGLRAMRDPSPANLIAQGKNVGMVAVIGSLGIAAVKELWDWILRGFKPADDEDSAIIRLVETMTEAGISNLYFGEYLGYAVQRIAFSERPYDPELSPLTGTIEDVVNGFIRMSRSHDPTDPIFWKGAEDIIVAGSALSGVPFVAPYRMVRKLITNLMETEASGIVSLPR